MEWIYDEETGSFYPYYPPTGNPPVPSVDYDDDDEPARQNPLFKITPGNPMISHHADDLSDYTYYNWCEEILKAAPSARSAGLKVTAKVTPDALEAALRAACPTGVYRMGSTILVRQPEAAFTIETSHTVDGDAFSYSLRGFGAVEPVRKIIDDCFAGQTIPEARMIDWMWMSTHGIQTQHVFMKDAKKLCPELYPYLGDVEGLLDRYIKSEAPILIMSGEPGTGKTSLIRHLIERHDWRVLTTYDPRVMADDAFYIKFIQSSYGLAVLEDADKFLADRVAEGNTVMSRLLNVSDGLMDIGHKKMIFTANLRSASQIDEAIMRPGRCFDVLHFRRLTPSEAINASKALGLPPPDTNAAGSFSVGDLVAKQEHGSLPSFGFAA